MFSIDESNMEERGVDIHENKNLYVFVTLESDFYIYRQRVRHVEPPFLQQPRSFM